MKSLNLAKPRVIMMLGIPGAGKSFFARQFADMFNTPLVSFDEIHHALFDEPQFNRQEDLLVLSLMKNQIKQLVKTDKTFIIDGGMSTRTAREAIMQFVRPTYDCLTVWVQTDMPGAEKRATKRSAKRPGDALNLSLPLDSFETRVRQLTEPFEKEDFIVVSGKHTFATQAKSILLHLTTGYHDTNLTLPARQTAPRRRPAAKPTRPGTVL